jgi:hypothetical protein
MATTLDAILKIGVKADGIQAVSGQIKGLETAAKGVDGAFGGLKNVVGNLTGGLVALGAGLSVAGLVAFAKSAIDAADNMRDLSQKTGVSVENLSKFQQVANQSGTDIESVGSAMIKLSKGMAEAAATGSGPAASALKTLGLSAVDAQGKLKGTDEVMFEVADKFRNMPDGAEKASLALQLFGKAGAGMIPMLNEGRQAIEGLGASMSTDFAKKADAYNDSLERVKTKFGQIGMAVAGQLLPYLTKAVDYLAAVGQGIQTWLVNNEAGIKQAIETIASVGKAIGPWVLGLGLVVGAYKTLQEAIKAAAIAQAALEALSGPAGWAMLAAAAAATALAVAGINKATESLGSSISTSTDNANSLTNALKSTGDAIEDDRKKQEEYNAAIEQAKFKAELLKATMDATSQAVQGQVRLTEAKYNADIAVNNAAISILKSERDQATTKEQKIKLTMQIMQLELANAKLQKDAANAQIKAEVDIADLKRRTAWEELRSAEAAILNAKAHGAKTDQLEQQLALQKIQTNNADKEYILSKQIAEQRMRAGEAQYQATQQQIRSTTDQELRSLQQIKEAANNIVPTSLSSSSSGGGGGGGMLSQMAAGTQAQGVVYGTAFAAGPQNNNRFAPWWATSAWNGFATGGYVTGPTLSLIGEGGQPEYIIPADQMANASASYMAGARGAAVLQGGGGAPQITIQTGPVMQLDGKQYVTVEDLQRTAQQVAEGVIGRLRTPAARLALGMR